MPPDMPVLQVLWEEVLGEILDRTQRFPKAVRFTFASRVDNVALDLLDLLVRARFAAPGVKVDLLREVDTDLARLRVLLRLSHARRYLDGKGYEFLSRRIDEAGRMAGGWRKEVSGRS